MSDRSKIRARRVSGNDVQQQREIATAVKNAREMALLPYTKRVTTQRGADAVAAGVTQRPCRADAGGRGRRPERGRRLRRAVDDRSPRSSWSEESEA